jgi:dihydroorotate dehydrogenase (NAD+) catalytic subunit
MDLSVRIGELLMPNPVGAASGAFGYGEEYESLVDIDALGALYTKAVTPEARAGNAAPRLADAPAGMLNSIGLANPGLEAFIADKLPALRGRACAVIVNVAGKTEDDYLRVVERLEGEEGVGGYEINVSCPNVAHGGMAFGVDCVLIERLTRRLRDAAEAGAGARASSGADARASSGARGTRRPIIIKLSPNVSDITAGAKAAEAGGADALSCINTLVGMVIDVKKKAPVLAMKTGGLSGPAIRPVGVAAVYRVARAVALPIIGLGGIGCADDALQYLLAGASAVQLGTAIFARPEAPAETLAGIRAFMEAEGLKRVADIAGLLR